MIRAGRARALSAALALVLLLATIAPAFAAEPASTPGTGGDPRSPGEGPGLVGDPGFAIGVVVLVGLLSVGLTLAYVRLTTPARRDGRS